jgi:hypothetical protein
MLEYNQQEPEIKSTLGAHALLDAFAECFKANNPERAYFHPNFINGDNYAHRAIMEYMTTDDWSGVQFESLDNYLFSCAWAATLAGVTMEDVIV